MTKTANELILRNAEEAAEAQYQGADLDTLARADVWHQKVLDRTKPGPSPERICALAAQGILQQFATERFGVTHLGEYVEKHHPELLTWAGLYRSVLDAVTKLFRHYASPTREAGPAPGEADFEKLLTEIGKAIETSDEEGAKRHFARVDSAPWWVWVNEITHAEETMNLRLDWSGACGAGGVFMSNSVFSAVLSHGFSAIPAAARAVTAAIAGEKNDPRALRNAPWPLGSAVECLVSSGRLAPRVTAAEIWTMRRTNGALQDAILDRIVADRLLERAEEGDPTAVEELPKLLVLGAVVQLAVAELYLDAIAWARAVDDTLATNRIKVDLPERLVEPLTWNGQQGASAWTSEGHNAELALSGSLWSIGGACLRAETPTIPCAPIQAWSRGRDDADAQKRRWHLEMLGAAARRVLSGQNAARAHVALENYRHALIGHLIPLSRVGYPVASDERVLRRIAALGCTTTTQAAA